jgi:hypothetical protein
MDSKSDEIKSAIIDGSITVLDSMNMGIGITEAEFIKFLHLVKSCEKNSIESVIINTYQITEVGYNELANTLPSLSRLTVNRDLADGLGPLASMGNLKYLTVVADLDWEVIVNLASRLKYLVEIDCGVIDVNRINISQLREGIRIYAYGTRYSKNKIEKSTVKWCQKSFSFETKWFS